MDCIWQWQIWIQEPESRLCSHHQFDCYMGYASFTLQKFSSKSADNFWKSCTESMRETEVKHSLASVEVISAATHKASLFFFGTMYNDKTFMPVITSLLYILCDWSLLYILCDRPHCGFILSVCFYLCMCRPIYNYLYLSSILCCNSRNKHVCLFVCL